jgi:uncharacterized protein
MSADIRLGLCGHEFTPLCSGALYWQAERYLIVADLHLEKGTAFASRGQMLPPYDSRTTLRRLAAIVAELRPATVIALGDSFHRSELASGLAAPDRALLQSLQRDRRWYWVTGNHDPEIPASAGGTVCAELTVENITFRHEPSAASGAIAGHLHPVARISRRGEAIRRKCFATDGERLVMPAFGAYTGGLDIFSEAFAGLLAYERLAVWLMGRDRVYPLFGRALHGG